MQRLHSADLWFYSSQAQTESLHVEQERLAFKFHRIIRRLIWLCFQLQIKTFEIKKKRIQTDRFHLGLLMIGIWDGDLERLCGDYFYSPLPAVKRWSFGPWKIRSGRTHCGREWLHSLFKSQPVSIPVLCIAWLKILSSAITHICSLCQIYQLIHKRNNSKWASASWTTVSPCRSFGSLG